MNQTAKTAKTHKGFIYVESLRDLASLAVESNIAGRCEDKDFYSTSGFGFGRLPVYLRSIIFIVLT